MSNKTNILFFHYGDDWLRGSEIVLLRILEHLDKARFSSFLVCNQEVMAQAAGRLGVDTFCLEIPEIMIDGAYRRLQLPQWAKTVRRLTRLIRELNIDLLYCNSGLPCQCGYYAAKLARRPVLAHIHAPYPWRYIFLYRFHKANKTVFVSNAIRDSMTAKARFLNYEVVYNAVDTEAFRPPPARHPELIPGIAIPTNRIVIGQIGSLIHRKGVDVLVRAFALLLEKHANVHLVLIGSGPEQKGLMDLATGLGINEHVTFVGDTDKPHVFFAHLIDINVLASRYETFGLSLIEAGAFALPSIGTHTGGIPEIITDGYNGFSFESENVQMLADKLTLLVEDEGKRHRMGINARSVVAEKFSFSNHLASITRILLEMVSN